MSPLTFPSWNDTMTRVHDLYGELDNIASPSTEHARLSGQQREQIAKLLGGIQTEYEQFFMGEIALCGPEEVQQVHDRVRLSLQSLHVLARDQYGLSMRTPQLQIPRSRLPRVSPEFHMREEHVVGGGLDDLPHLMTNPATRRAALLEKV